jgi:serine/threonine protein kinase
MLVGKPPFQTKDVKAIYKKIKGLDYSFPSSVDIADEAIDLIEAILDREPQNRPSAHEILCNQFQYSGPFPRSIPAYASDTAPDFSNLTSAQSARNYLYVQKLAGASLIASATTSSTPSIPESEEFSNEPSHPPEPPAQVVALNNGTNVVAQELALEKEVRKVLDPGSPISELLKSARKPLMVSPRALAAQREKEKNEIARKALNGNAAAGRAERQQQTEKENIQPPQNDAKRSTRAAAAMQVKKEQVNDSETGLENAVRALRVTNGASASPNRMPTSASTTSIRDRKRPHPPTSTSTITVKRESEDNDFIHSARDAYLSCHQLLQASLTSSHPILPG